MSSVQHAGRRATPRQEPSWVSYITIDLIMEAAYKTILHPFIAWMMPLSLRAVTIPYSHPSFQLTVAYACLLTLWYAFSIWSNSYAFGSPREMNFDEEVVVITGGSSGLGLAITNFYRMRGASVAVLDIQAVSEDDESGISYYDCDVSDAAQIQKVAESIKKQLGPPTILINNAGIVNGKSILNSSNDELERVNLLSHFMTVKQFLPDMLEEGRGTIVTISSVLGYLGSANLADYSASKAGLIGFHASLRAELASSKSEAAQNIKTILVAPGQLGTGLFSSIKTPSEFLAPIVEPVWLAREIVQMIDNGRGGEVWIPFYAKWIPIFLALPSGIQTLLRQLSGLDEAAATISIDKKVR